MSGSLGTVQNSQGVGLTPLDYRMILQATYPNVGVIKGMTVTGGSGLNYNVAAGVGVTSRGDSDGNRLYSYSGGSTEAVAAGDPTFSRIDTVWVKADDPSIDNDSFDVHVGVTQGTPSATPAKPTIPTDCTELRSFTVASGTTVLSSGAAPSGNIVQSVPYGAVQGILHKYVYNTAGTPKNQKNLTTAGSGKIVLPTKRNIVLNLQVQLSVSNNVQSSTEGGFWIYFRVDGKAIYRGQGAYSNQRWDNVDFRWPVTLDAGTHTVDFQYAKTSTSPDFKFETTDLQKAMLFTVEDGGVAA